MHYPRYAIDNIREALLDTPVVFIMGPRQCGKTTIVKSLINKDCHYINLDDQTQLSIAKQDPSGFIKNLTANQIAIDEVQRAPELLIAIKQAVDEQRTPGRFLLTGSSNALLLPKVSDSLAGRIESIHLDTLSECEIEKVQPSFLSKLTEPNKLHANDTRINHHLIKRIVTGCFPEPLQRKAESRIKAWYKQYINSLIQKDIKDIEHIDYPDKMLKLLKLTAFYSGKLLNFNEIGNKLNLDNDTIKKYIGLLEQLFLVKLLPAWHSNEYKRLVKTPKLHLSDTGLICAVMDITENNLTQYPSLAGHLL